MGLKMKTGEIAEMFDVSRRTVTNWKAAGCPVQSVGGRGKEDVYDSAQVHGWLLAQALGDGAAKDPDMKAARLEILKTEAKLRTLRLRKQTGELIETDAVTFTMKHAFINIRSGFRGLVPWLGNECLSLAREDNLNTRKLFNAIDERLDVVIFSAYVAQARSLAELANRSGGQAEKMASAAWKTAFPTDWQAEYDRLEQSGAIDRTGPDNKPSRSDRKRNKK